MLGYADLLVIAIYALCIGAIARWNSRFKNDTVEFLLAGRRLTLPVFVATLVSSWYGGILGIAEFTGMAGLGTWLVQGILWYVAYLIFALFFAARIRSMPFYTVPDILEHRFNRKVALLGGIFTYLMVNPAPYILSLGLVTQLFLPVSLPKAIAMSALFTVVYTILSGFRGIVYIDAFQCLSMYMAFICLFAMSLYKWGGLNFLQTNLTNVPGYEQHLTITGGMSPGYILVWGGMACWIFVDPNFYQRCFAARSPKVARNGILISILCWAVFDILSCGTALYAFAAQNAGKLALADPKMAHLILSEHVLPSPLKGFFLVGVLSAIMSTADSFLFAGGMNIARDYYWRFFNREATGDQMVRVTRIAIIATAALGVILAIYMPSVKDLWYTLGTVGLSGLLIPVLCSFKADLCSSSAALGSMLAGEAASLIWLSSGAGGGTYPWELQPLYPGLGVSLIVYFTIFKICRMAATRNQKP